MTGQHLAKYKSKVEAEKFAERCRKAWPGMQFDTITNPFYFGWVVARVTDGGNKIHSYVMRSRGPMPGEEGYVEAIQEVWELRYLGRVATFKVLKSMPQREKLRQARATIGLHVRARKVMWSDDRCEVELTNGHALWLRLIQSNPISTTLGNFRLVGVPARGH